MFNKKYAFIFLLLMLAIFAVSSASAADLQISNCTDSPADEDVGVKYAEAANGSDDEASGNEIEEIAQKSVSGDGESEAISANNASEEVSSTDDSDVLENGTGDDPLRTAKFTVKKTGSYYKDNKLTVTVTDKETGVRLKNVRVVFEFNSYKRIVKTNSNGVATLNVPYNSGTYSLNIHLDDANYTDKGYKTSYSIAKIPMRVVAPSLTLYYNNNGYLSVKVLDIKNKPVKGVLVTIKLNGKTRKLRTTSVGTAKLKVSGLNAGKYNAAIMISLKNYKTKTSKATVNIKPRPIVITAKNEETLGVRVTVKDKLTNKALNGVPLYLKIYTGSSYRTVKMITGVRLPDKLYGGVIYMNTGFLGKHTVSVSPANKNYVGSASTYFYIPEFYSFYQPLYLYCTGGKIYTNTVGA